MLSSLVFVILSVEAQEEEVVIPESKINLLRGSASTILHFEAEDCFVKLYFLGRYRAPNMKFYRVKA
jgi:hypothetical protein